jgi:hypothetical protein
MALPIPKGYIPEVNKIRNLPDSIIDELVHALESAPVTADSEQLALTIADSIPSIGTEDLKGILGFVYGLYHVRQFSEMDNRAFLDELIAGVRQHAKPELAEGDLPRMRERFRRMLGIKKLSTLSKATNLQRAGERLYCLATIFSDVRPVFGQDVKSKPVGAVITHTLKLAYHEGGDHKEFFIILDDQDLEELQAVIHRARQKSETLTTLLVETKIPRLGI